MWISALWVAFGSALGGLARFWVNELCVEKWGAQYPWGTFLVNISGSFIIGYFAALTASMGKFPVSAEARVFVMTGICGGFTTFSSFSLQTYALAQKGEWLAAGLNAGGSVVLCLAAVALGSVLGHAIAHPA